MKKFLISVSPQNTGMRLDQLVAQFAKENKLGFSRTRIQRAVCKGGVRLKDGTHLKPHYKVKAGDEFSVEMEEERSTTLQPEDISLEVVYEDKDLAVINKPAGLVVHPGAGNQEHTLANALLARFKELSSVNPDRPGIVHRLDKDTSGLIVIAKNNDAHFELSKQFAEHSIKRKYVALVKGKVEFDENIIEVPIGRHPLKRQNMSAGFGEKLKYAKTRYRTLKRSENYSILELEPFTGRTHQLRVHLASLGHPILGDSKYGKAASFSRLALHAQYLGFIHPASKKFVEFSCGLPAEFHSLLNKNS
jgi:23S rRNA pseudouridine1911/1915/1917 synthase